MKKVIRTIAVAAFIMASTTIMAKEPKLESAPNSKNLVFEWDAQMANASVRFVDSEGNVIYSDALTHIETYIKRFNLETLEQGNYLFEVENELKEIAYSIKITKDDVVVLDTDESLKPIFNNKDGQVFVNYLNSDKAEVKVVIYDSLGRELFRETFENELVVGKVFNFTEAFEGEYTIAVQCDSKTFYETITVK